MNKQEAIRVFKTARLKKEYASLNSNRPFTVIECPKCGSEQKTPPKRLKFEFECNSKKCRPNKKTSGYRFTLITGTPLHNSKDLASYVRAAQHITEHPFTYPSDELLQRILGLKTEKAVNKRREAIYNAMKPGKLDAEAEYVITCRNNKAYAFEIKPVTAVTLDQVIGYNLSALRIAEDIETLIREYFVCPQSKFVFMPYENTPSSHEAMSRRIATASIPIASISKTKPNAETERSWRNIIQAELKDLSAYSWSRSTSQTPKFFNIETMFYRYLDIVRTNKQNLSSPFAALLIALAATPATDDLDKYLYKETNCSPDHWQQSI